MYCLPKSMCVVFVIPVCLDVPSICQIWVCMRDVILELAICALMFFLCSILGLVCSGSRMHVVCILPFGILCLSA